MKRILLFFITAQVFVIQTQHQIVTIYNKTSNLKFDHAYKMSNRKKQPLPALTKRLKESSDKKKQHVVVEHTIGTETFGIKMKDDSGKSVDLLADGQPTSNIEFGRNKTKKIVEFPQSCTMADGAYCARALMQDQNQNPLASASYAHKQQDALLNLHISGSPGNYKLSYEPAV